MIKQMGTRDSVLFAIMAVVAIVVLVGGSRLVVGEIPVLENSRRLDVSTTSEGTTTSSSSVFGGESIRQYRAAMDNISTGAGLVRPLATSGTDTQEVAPLAGDNTLLYRAAINNAGKNTAETLDVSTRASSAIGEDSTIQYREAMDELDNGSRFATQSNVSNAAAPELERLVGDATTLYRAAQDNN